MFIWKDQNKLKEVGMAHFRKVHFQRYIKSKIKDLC